MIAPRRRRARAGYRQGAARVQVPSAGRPARHTVNPAPTPPAASSGKRSPPGLDPRTAFAQPTRPPRSHCTDRAAGELRCPQSALGWAPPPRRSSSTVVVQWPVEPRQATSAWPVFMSEETAGAAGVLRTCPGRNGAWPEGRRLAGRRRCRRSGPAAPDSGAGSVSPAHPAVSPPRAAAARRQDAEALGSNHGSPVQRVEV